MSMNMWCVALGTSLLCACGGGGGGGSQPAPPQPSISISGAEARYWQDDELRITFTARNMDTSTVVYSIDNLEEELAQEYFYFDAGAGVLTDDPEYYMDPKAHSLVVSATDAAGTTASTTLTFDIDLVPTTLALADTVITDLEGNTVPGNVLFASTRSGDALLDFFSFQESILSFSCHGSLETNVEDVSVAGECDGYAFDSSTAVDRFDSDGGDINFYDEAGLALGSLYVDGVGRYITELRTDNEVIPGVYLFRSQYSPPYREEDVSNAGYYDPAHNFSTALMRVTDGYAFESLPSVEVLLGQATDTALDCQYSGQIDQSSLDEHPITSRNRNLLADIDRTLSGTFDVTACEVVISNPINQTDGRFVAWSRYYFNGDHQLFISGSGDSAQGTPIWLGRFQKMCDNDGTVVPSQVGNAEFEAACTATSEL